MTVPYGTGKDRQTVRTGLTKRQTVMKIGQNKVVELAYELEVDGQMSGSIGRSILENPKTADRQLGMLDFKPMELVEEIADLDVVSMTPIDALNKLFELNEKAKRI